MVMVTAMRVIPAMAIAMQMIAVIPAARMPAMAIATVTQKIAMILTAQIPAMVWCWECCQWEWKSVAARVEVSKLKILREVGRSRAQ